MEELTDFQKRVLATIEAFPNSMANTWEIAWNGFAKEWNAKRPSHGAIFRCILQAGQALRKKGLIVILPPRDQHDTYTFSSLAKWKAAEQSVHPTVATVAPQEVNLDSRNSG
jgi:hypothetical protein